MTGSSTEVVNRATREEGSDVASRGREQRPPRLLVIAACLFAGVVLVFVASPNAVVSDSMRVVPVAMSILERQTISLDHYAVPDAAAKGRWGGPAPVPGYAVDTVDGHHYPGFPWAVSLFLLPVVGAVEAGHAVGLGQGVEADALERNSDWPYQVVAMSMVVGMATVLLFSVASEMLRGLPPRRRMAIAAVVALTFAFATPAWSTATRSAWQHGPSMLCLSAALLFAVKAERSSPRWVWAMGPALAAAYAVRPTNAIPLAVLLAWIAYRHRPQLLGAAAGAAAVFTAWALVNVRAWGEVLPPYYAGGRIKPHPDLVEALLANLFSPGRGLFTFSPILLVAVGSVATRVVRGRLTSLELALAVSVAAHWVAISTFPHWWGGDSFGPRLFSDMVPLLVVLAVPGIGDFAVRERRTSTRSRVLLATVMAGLIWSVAVHAQGALFRASYCWNDQPRDIDLHPDRAWSISDAQLTRGIRSFLFGPGHSAELSRGGVAATGCPAPASDA